MDFHIFLSSFFFKKSQNVSDVLLPAIIFTAIGIVSLKTEIDNHQIKLRWSPFQRSYTKIKWSDIDKVEVVEYTFIGGGYGIRYSPKYGLVHNVYGQYGIVLILKNGSKKLIGTNKPKIVSEFIRNNVG
ncbi:MAG: hypothetical protein GDA51_11075 [Ekhidna sp.]|nr:hypothetical protein [Ekhidna sp.]MBC6410567.1 hypothetical protein [Ekhidna sp.]MBC6426980.1 hypothetical protein [Ekhidna sp.]